MMHLITGGSGSGKSAYAEQCVALSGLPVRYYVATMKPYGEEGRLCVQRHRRMRRDKNFITVECFDSLEQLALPKGAPGAGAAALLECVSNLAANEQFDVGGTEDEIVGRIERGIRRLRAQTDALFVVTCDVSADGQVYEEETMRYIRLMGRINQRLAQLADEVTEVVCGIPVPIKAGQK
ncbi:MAG: bifunctional adenosylcobinamide kinase/adenosylcobinamide-phosphate guanylyltransferase [Clostridiales bacterium]|nr:bifunctional adenosylcobinamide kinase/adenosylcobinamide-phosphate guanylyltransferase [Clostridiales bacterium]